MTADNHDIVVVGDLGRSADQMFELGPRHPSPMNKESYHHPAENGARSSRVLEARHTSVATVLCIAVNKPHRLKSVAKPAYCPAAPAEVGAYGCSFGMRDCERCCDVNSRPSQFGALNYAGGG